MYRKTKKKKNAFRKLSPAYTPSVSDLTKQLENHILQQIKTLVVKCFRAGFVVSGPKKVKEEIDQLAVLFVPNHRIQQRWKKLFTPKPIYSLQMSSQDLGNWLRKGPRQVIGLLPNRHLLSFNQYLHLLGQLR